MRRLSPLVFVLACGADSAGDVGTEGPGSTSTSGPTVGPSSTGPTTEGPSSSADATGDTTSTDGGSDSDTTGGPPAVERHWIGGSGDWTDNAHWSETPNGPPGASVPDANSVVTIEGDVAVALNGGNVEVRGLTCDGATLSADVETEVATGGRGVDVATCILPMDGGHALLGFRFVADAVFDHVQGEAGGTAVDYLDADGNVITIRPVGGGRSRHGHQRSSPRSWRRWADRDRL